MPPNSTENNEIPVTADSSNVKKNKHTNIVVYIRAIFLSYYHVAGIYGLYLCFSSAKWATIGFGLLMYLFGTLGVTAGVHRLWSHRSYQAKLPLQIILMVFHSIAFQKTAIGWVKDHRLHHKYSDTDKDPHNANRGFFYSHMGWLMTQQSEEIAKEKKCLDMSDIYNNPVLRFQSKYALPVIGTLCFALPTFIPIYFWGETLNNAWHVNMLRYIVYLNVTCCVNSVAHIWGYKPYDKNILPCQNASLSVAALGEGFHNYHHAFPWDYQASEFGNKKLNLTTWFIDFFTWFGLAYDLKTASKEVVRRRAERTGDGTDLWGKLKTDSMQ